MDNEKGYMFLSNMVNLEIDRELFINQMKLFSKYLVCLNPDYKYNETYLDKFCLDFLEFKKYVDLKHQIFIELIRLLVCNIDLDITKDLQVTMDDFWTYSLQYEQSVYACMNSISNIVCRDKAQIKGIMIYEKRRYIFIKEYQVLNNQSLLTSTVDLISNELITWTKEKYNAKE